MERLMREPGNGKTHARAGKWKDSCESREMERLMREPGNGKTYARAGKWKDSCEGREMERLMREPGNGKTHVRAEIYQGLPHCENDLRVVSKRSQLFPVGGGACLRAI
jgi:hypothetical protein